MFASLIFQLGTSRKHLALVYYYNPLKETESVPLSLAPII